jgi:hypothetical protein
MQKDGRLRDLLQSKRIYFVKYILLEIVFTEYVHDEVRANCFEHL